MVVMTLNTKTAVSIKKVHTVKPAQETPITKLSISESDQINPVTHAPTIYFYRLADTAADEYPFAAAVEILKTSLSKVLVPFYPLAGRLNRLPGNQNRLEIDCNSLGAELYEAESELSIDDYEDFKPTPELRKLIPSVDYITTQFHEIPNLMIQITQFRCGGRSIGIAMSHIVIDGASAVHFVSEWARIAKGLPLSQQPYLDRTKPWQITTAPQQCESSEPKFDHTEFNPLPLVIGSKNNFEERGKPSDVALLRLTKSQMENIKNQANSSSTGETLSHPYSRFEAVAAHVWRSTSKARNQQPQQATNVRIAVDARQRLNPPLPEGYFGNAIFLTMATSTAADLLNKPLSYASSRIRESIEKMTNEYIRSAISLSKAQDDMNKFRVFHTLGCTEGNFFGNPNVDITSWITLPMYGTDFGWGKEIYLGPGGLGYDGKCFILPDRQGDGSFVLALRMQVEHLDYFKKFLYQDI